MRKKPNILIPRGIYKIRREHYVYWEISRIARGLPKTFTYSAWDPKAVSKILLYYFFLIIENDVSCG